MKRDTPSESEPDDQASAFSLRRLSDDYLDHLRHERKVAKTTQVGYTSWLNIFHRWLDANGHPDATLSDFTPTVLRTYQYAMSRAKKRPRTILSAFNPIKGLGQFLVDHGLLPTNPAKEITYPKKDAARRQTVSTTEALALLGAVERLPDVKQIPLANALLHVLVFAGVRFDELRSLRVQDVNLDNGTILVAHGKGDKSRLLYPPAPCMKAVGDWLRTRSERYGSEIGHDWLWAYNAHRRLGEEGVRDLLEDIKAVAGLRDAANIKPHSLRHSFATRMMHQGAPLSAIKAALGHSLMSTTFQYLHLDEEEAKKMAVFATLETPDPATPPGASLTPERPTASHRREEYVRQRRERG